MIGLYRIVTQGCSHDYSIPCHIQVVYESFLLTNIINYCAWYQLFLSAVSELYGIDSKSYIYLWNTSQGVSSPSIMSSHLETFSNNPRNGSFGALPFQETLLQNMRTNGSSDNKEVYCQGTKDISRIKLTCIKIV